MEPEPEEDPDIGSTFDAGFVILVYAPDEEALKEAPPVITNPSSPTGRGKPETGTPLRVNCEADATSNLY